MMFRYFLIIKLGLILFLFSLHDLKAQTSSYNSLRDNFVTFPNPKAWAFANYGNYPVSLYTGTVDISNDLFSIKEFGYDINVKLTYNQLENKPSTFPSEVGLGFSLQAGGVITRVLKAIPDDDVSGFYFHKGARDFYNQNRESYLNGVLDKQIDSEPDEFYFKFGKYSGIFYFDKNGSIIQSQFNSIKITPIFNNGIISGFEIIDPEGIKFEFKDLSYSTFTGINSTKTPYVCAWYLSRVSLLNNKSINFEYYPNSLSLSTANYFNSYSKSEIDGVIIGMVPNSLSEKNTYVHTHFEKYLKSISFSNGKIEFLMSDRIDRGAQRTRKIESIKLSDISGQFLYSYSFNYFEDQNQRFKLKNISYITPNNVELFRAFEYNPTLLPWNNEIEYPYYSNQVDYWGYFNGKGANENTTLIPEIFLDGKLRGGAKRESDLDFATAEILQKITYPTGGFTQLEYELNDFSNQGDSYSPKRNVKVTTQSLSFEFEDGSFSQDPNSLVFTLKTGTNIQVSKAIKGAGPNTKWIKNSQSVNYEQYNLYLQAGTYNLGSLLNTNYLTHYDNSDVYSANGGIMYDFEEVEIIGNTKPYKGGGIRISKIKTNDGNNTITKEYIYKNDIKSQVSSGILTKMSVYGIRTQDLIPNIQGVFLSSNPILSYNESEIIGYKSIFELNSDSSYTRFLYSTIEEYPDNSNGFELVYADHLLSPTTSNRNLRGKLIKEEIFNSQHQLIKSIDYNYALIEDSRLSKSNYILVQPTFPILLNSAGGGSYYDRISATMNSVYERNFPLLILKNTMYKTIDSGKEALRSESLFYDNALNINVTRSIDSISNGYVKVNYFLFPHDYTTSFNALISKNIVNKPIEIVHSIKKGNNEYVTDGSIYEYQLNGNVKKYFKAERLSSSFPFRFSNRSNYLFPPLGSTSIFQPDEQYKIELNVVLNDFYGNPQEVKVKEEPVTTYLWGYEGQYPIAEIKNATYADVLAVLTPATINNLNAVNVTETTVTNAMNKLRTDSRLSKAMITSYTYQPLVGMKSKTDPRGVTEYYEYDGMQRLKAVLDQVKNVTSSMDYHYRSN